MSTRFLTISAKPQGRHAPRSHIQLTSRGLQIGVWVIAALLLLALASFLLLDATLVRIVHESGIDRWLRKNQHLAEIIRWPGHLAFALVVTVALLLFHPRRYHAMALTLLAVLFSGSNWFFKWVAGRYRPTNGSAVTEFSPFPGALRGLFHERNLSMPSGDVTLAFALAAALAHLLPRHAALFFIWPALVAAERVAENAHHLSDVLAGAVLGLLGFHLAHLACTLMNTKAQADAQRTSNRE